MSGEAIRWPAEFEPARSPVHVVNRIEAAVPPALVWDRLIAAARWPDWYANSSKVRIAGDAFSLSAGCSFTWRTFGVDLVSRVEEFVPEERIAWTAKSFGVWAYHAWLITAAPQGCTILTEETQHGVLSRAGKLLFPRRMGEWHQRWLEGLAAPA